MSEWRRLAACRDADPEAAFAGAGTVAEDEFKRTYCRPCPVKRECLELGLRFESTGVYGGLNARQRGRMFGKTPGKPEPSLPRCGTVQGYRHHREVKHEEACPPCKAAWTGYCNERRRIRLGRTA